MRRHASGSSHIAVIFSAVILSVALPGCGSEPKPAETQSQPASAAQAPAAAPEAAAAQPNQKRYDMVGTVTEVDKAGKTATVDAEDMPGFMSAMTMGYTVKDDPALEKLSAGDRITAKVVVADGGAYWLENIVITGKAAPAK